MLRRIITLLVAVAVLAALAWALWPKPVAVETATIGRQTIAVEVEEEGKSRIREIYTVSAPIGGALLRLSLHAGDAVVAKQTVVASIKPPAPALLDARARRIAETAVEAAKAAVDLAEAQVEQASAQLEHAIGEWQRAAALLAKGTTTRQAYDAAVLAAAVAKTEMARAKSNLVVQQRNLESAQAVLFDGSGSGDNCCVEVHAPIDGKVLKVLAENEQVLQAGTPLITIGDPGDLEVVVDLLSRDAVGIAPGAPAVIEGWGGAPIKAIVERIDPAAVTKVSALGIEEQRVTTVLKLTDPPQAWARLGHDFRVTVRIETWRGDGLLAVPMGALFRQGTDWAVFLAKDGKAQLQVVELGQRNGDAAEVKSGLAEGDRVILHPSDLVKDQVSIAY